MNELVREHHGIALSAGDQVKRDQAELKENDAYQKHRWWRKAKQI